MNESSKGPADQRPGGRSTGGTKPPTGGRPATASSGGEGPIPLAQPETTPARAAGAGRDLNAALCPACSHGMSPAAVICINCGFDRRTGFTRRTGVDAAANRTGTLNCPSCGYDLTGLRQRVCPECGEQNLGKHNPIHKKRKARKEQTKLWATPAAMLTIGTGICLWHVIDLGGEVALAWAGMTAMSILGAFCGYAITAMKLTGWPYDVGNSLLRIGGILMVSTALLSVVPLGGLFGIFMLWVALALMLIPVMDMELGESMIAATLVLFGGIIGGFVGVLLIAPLL